MVRSWLMTAFTLVIIASSTVVSILMLAWDLVKGTLHGVFRSFERLAATFVGADPNMSIATCNLSLPFLVGSSSLSSIYDYSTEPELLKRQRRTFTLVLDLDETLVHTSDQYTPNADLRVEIVQKTHTRRFYVLKRPYLDLFLQTLARYFDIILYTASHRRYADPVVDLIDTNRVIHQRFFRDSCIQEKATFVKDLDRISTDIGRTIIIDNSPNAFGLHQDNGIAIEPWFEDPGDDQLLRLIPFLIGLRCLDDVRSVLKRQYHANKAV